MNEMMTHMFFSHAIDPRRRKEKMDAQMIREDHSAVANLPQEGYQREFRSRGIMRNPFEEIG